MSMPLVNDFVLKTSYKVVHCVNSMSEYLVRYSMAVAA